MARPMDAPFTATYTTASSPAIDRTAVVTVPKSTAEVSGDRSGPAAEIQPRGSGPRFFFYAKNRPEPSGLSDSAIFRLC